MTLYEIRKSNQNSFAKQFAILPLVGISFFGIDVILLIILIVIILLIIAIPAILYTIVPADKADVVIQRGTRKVFSAHLEYSPEGKAAYFKIPAWVPGVGMIVHRMPLSMLEIPISDFLAFDKDRARFVCDIVAFCVIKDPVIAAMRFPAKLEDLGLQISKVVQATMRDSTTKKSVREIINDREGIIASITTPLSNTVAEWGLQLKDTELIDFKDPEKPISGEEEPPHVIRDISSIIEVQINSDARQKNAEQEKIARLKEAEAEEIAKKRELERDEQIGMRQQAKEQKIFESEKLAREKKLDVDKVQVVKSQQIEKERAMVLAEQQREVEKINREKKKLEGEGDRLMNEEQAKGKASFVKEQGLAEAVAKEALQDALNKFGDTAIRALIAEKLVEMQQAVGVAGAKALEKADLKVFSGGGADAQKGFELGAMLESILTSSSGTAGAVMNRLSRPNDLGFKDWYALLNVMQSQSTKKVNEPPENKEDWSQDTQAPQPPQSSSEDTESIDSEAIKKRKSRDYKMKTIGKGDS
jgi:flotillin